MDSSLTITTDTLEEALSAPAVPLSPPDLGTLVGFLCGQREAILSVASSRPALWLGLAWVLLAGLFREYDQENLLVEPWHALLPLLVSTALAALVWGGFDFPKVMKFREVLTCVWWMSPMAMMYSVPVEYFWSPRDATAWNLSMLGIVSVWRVLLLARVVGVLRGVSSVRMLFPVMWIADTLTLIAMALIPLPLIQFMGGVRLTESEELINVVRGYVILLGGGSWIVWMIGSCIPPHGGHLEPRVASDQKLSRVHWVVVGSLLAGMGLALSQTQPAQRRRTRIQHLLRKGSMPEAVHTLATLSPTELPPHWDIPPRVSLGERIPSPYALIEAVAAEPQCPEWLFERCDEKLDQLHGWSFHAAHFWGSHTDADLSILADYFRIRPQLLRRWNERDDYASVDLRCYIAMCLHDWQNENWDQNARERDDRHPTRRPLELLGRLLEVAIDQDDGERESAQDCPSKAELSQRLNALTAAPTPPASSP